MIIGGVPDNPGFAPLGSIVIIENETDLAAARALISALGTSDKPADVGRLRAQALILQADEAEWPVAPSTPAEILAYLVED